MNPRQVGVLFEDLSILICGGVPVLPRLEGFRLKFVGLVGSRSDGSHFLSRARGKLREVVRHNVENFRVFRKIALQGPQRVDGRLRLIEAHRATRRSHRHPVFQWFVRCLRQRFLQHREGFLAASFGSQINGMLNGSRRSRSRR